MKEVPVEGGGVALIDNDDFEKVSRYVWKSWRTPDGREYIRANGEVMLHRLILGFPKGRQIDHKNHNTRDNRKENLRVVSMSENQQNRKGANKNNSTGIRGVSFKRDRGKYAGFIKVNRRSIFCGYFDNIRDAEQAVLESRLRHMTYSDGR